MTKPPVVSHRGLAAPIRTLALAPSRIDAGTISHVGPTGPSPNVRRGPRAFLHRAAVVRHAMDPEALPIERSMHATALIRGHASIATRTELHAADVCLAAVQAAELTAGELAMARGGADPDVLAVLTLFDGVGGHGAGERECRHRESGEEHEAALHGNPPVR